MRTAYVPESSIWRAFGSSLPPRFITAGVRLRLTASRWLSMSSIQSAASRWLVAQSVLYRLLPICPDTCPARRPSRPIGHLWCFSIWIFQMIVCWFGVEQVQWAQLEVWGSLLIKTSNREARGAALTSRSAHQYKCITSYTEDQLSEMPSTPTYFSWLVMSMLKSSDDAWVLMKTRDVAEGVSWWWRRSKWSVRKCIKTVSQISRSLVPSGYDLIHHSDKFFKTVKCVLLETWFPRIHDQEDPRPRSLKPGFLFTGH